MPILFNLVEGLSGIAVSLGVGASTFAIIFFFLGMRAAADREAGRPYLKTVFVVLRIAMVLILLTEIAKVVLYTFLGVPLAALVAVDVLVFIWTVIAVLYLNAILMTLHYMPLRLGPAIQATSWYTLGIVSTLPIVTFTYLPLILVYLGGIILAAAGIEYGKRKLASGE